VLSQCSWNIFVRRNFAIVIPVDVRWCVGVNELEVGIRVGVCCLGLIVRRGDGDESG
jgi:hypothetical protein